MPKHWRKITYKIIDSDNKWTSSNSSSSSSSDINNKKMMNLRENDEKCFMSNNRKYFSTRDKKERKECKKYGRMCREKRILANDTTIQFLCIM